MITKINNAVTATNGYKTKTAVFVYLILQLLGDKIPLTPGNKMIVVNLVELLMASGLLHDFWRNRERILDFFSNLFTKKNSIMEQTTKALVSLLEAGNAVINAI
jgi:hypothetical protein